MTSKTMDLNIYTYSFPFKKPFTSSAEIYHPREGIILELVQGNITALGEAAPLPGFSRESQQEALSQLKEYKDEILRMFSGEITLGDLQVFHRKNDIYPSLQFGLDTLAVDYLAQRDNIPAQQLLFEKTPDRVKVNGVLTLEEAGKTYNSARQLVERGFQTLKIKTGANFEVELEVLKKIRSDFPNLILRLDANRAWNLQEATHNLKQLEALQIEYCEEPLMEPSPENLKKIASETSVPIALDESLVQIKNLETVMPHISAVVLKPMVLGGLAKLFATNRLAKHHNNKVIYTTSLESGIGRTMTAILAAGLGNSSSAHGLATGSLLKMDVWHDGTYINNGSFLLPDRVELGKRYQSNHKYLDKVHNW